MLFVDKQTKKSIHPGVPTKTAEQHFVVLCCDYTMLVLTGITFFFFKEENEEEEAINDVE